MNLSQLKLTVSNKWQTWRRSKPFWFGVGAVVVVGAIGAMVAFDAVPEVVDDLHIAVAKPTIKELRGHLKDDPSDAGTRVALGHALFEAKKRKAALREYDLALARDKGAADEKMLSNLVASFGTKDQGTAASIITRFKLTEIEGKLDDLAKHSTYTVRWGALQTLERIGKASRSDFVTAWIKDLGSSKCEVRQAAVENLGKEGDRRAIDAIRAAHKKDKESTPWFAGTCLGNRADEAEKKILASR